VSKVLLVITIMCMFLCVVCYVAGLLFIAPSGLHPIYIVGFYAGVSSVVVSIIFVPIFMLEQLYIEKSDNESEMVGKKHDAN